VGRGQLADQHGVELCQDRSGTRLPWRRSGQRIAKTWREPARGRPTRSAEVHQGQIGGILQDRQQDDSGEIASSSTPGVTLPVRGRPGFRLRTEFDSLGQYGTYGILNDLPGYQ